MHRIVRLARHALRRCASARRRQLDGVGKGERCDFEHDLTVNVEWDLAGAQDSHPGRGVEQTTARSAAASMTCSQLSRITNAVLLLMRSNNAATPPTFNVATSVSITSSGVAAVSSLANQTPPGATSSDELSRRPVAIATAVLPTPPGPTISTSRPSASRSATAATSVRDPRDLPDRRQVAGRPVWPEASGRGRGDAE